MSEATPELSARTRWLVERLFTEEQQSDAIQVLNSLGDMRSDRMCFAVLKFSVGEIVEHCRHGYTMRLPQKGSLNQLRQGVELALSDYCDLLVWVGFGASVTAHETWYDEIRNFWDSYLVPDVNSGHVGN